MRRPLLVTIALALAAACGAVLAQSGALAAVTMRVLEDLEGLDVVIIELDGAVADGAAADPPA